jgi:DNA adenine methylase
MSDYSKKTRDELIALCKENKIKGYSTKKKAELIELLNTTSTKPSSTTYTKDTTQITKPFLKWVGGKTQILDKVLSEFPKTMTNYHEPFLGGGSVLLGLLSHIRDKKITVSGRIYASDLNANIINLYKTIQSNPELLISEVKTLISEYTESAQNNEVNRTPKTKEEAMTSQESYYYWIRSKFNSEDKEQAPIKAAQLLFLNKTCFRGVYREGPKGFNVPFGNYTNPGIMEEAHIREVSNLIKDVVFTTASFTESLKKVEPGDFIYLDPPYAPETETSFVGYTKDGFNLDEHNKLFELCSNFTSTRIKWVMSNADVKLVKDAFPIPLYETKIISARRSINSKNPEAKTNEVLIRN